MIMSTLYKTNTWIIIVLAQRNNTRWVDMSLNSDTLFWFLLNQSLLLLLNTACSAGKQLIPTNCIVFGLTRPILKPTIHPIRDEHVNNYTTDAVLFVCVSDNIVLPITAIVCPFMICANKKCIRMRTSSLFLPRIFWIEVRSRSMCSNKYVSTSSCSILGLMDWHTAYKKIQSVPVNVWKK